MVYLFSSAHPNTDTVLGPGHPPSLPSLILYLSLFIYWAGGGHRQKTFPVVLGQGYHGLSPSPWPGLDLIKTETRGWLALLKGRDKEGSEMMKSWLGGQAEAGKRQKLPSSPEVMITES